MSARSVFLILLSILIGWAGCESDDDLPVPADVRAFLAGLNLPQQQEIRTTLVYQGVYVFQVAYGEGADCPSGCIYARRYGLKNAEKIGEIQHYNFQSTEEVLFSSGFLDTLRSTDLHIYYSIFLPTLVADTSTPHETLKRIALGLYDQPRIDVARALMGNSSVWHDAEILVILADLPVFINDPYRQVRAIAQALLDLLAANG